MDPPQQQGQLPIPENNAHQSPLAFSGKYLLIHQVQALLSIFTNKETSVELLETSLQELWVSFFKETHDFVIMPPFSPYPTTLLTEAAKFGHLEIATYLIKNGALVNFQSKKLGDRTPLHFACFYGSYHVVSLLKQHNANHLLSDDSGCLWFDLLLKIHNFNFFFSAFQNSLLPSTQLFEETSALFYLDLALARQSNLLSKQ